MKPKDLLEHLEKGDRTMYQLTKTTDVPQTMLDDLARAMQSSQQLSGMQNPVWQGNQWNQRQVMTTSTGLSGLIGGQPGGIIQW